MRKYTLDLLSEVDMLGSKLANVLIDFNHKTDMTAKGKKVDKKHYQKLVGKLIYLSTRHLFLCLGSEEIYA